MKQETYQKCNSCNNEYSVEALCFADDPKHEECNGCWQEKCVKNSSSITIKLTCDNCGEFGHNGKIGGWSMCKPWLKTFRQFYTEKEHGSGAFLVGPATIEVFIKGLLAKYAKSKTRED